MRQEQWYGTDGRKQQSSSSTGATMVFFLWAVALCFIGRPSTVYADALVHLGNAIRIEKNQATQHYFGLDRILRERHLSQNSAISGEVRSTFVGLRDSLVSIKTEIEAAAPELAQNQYEAFTHVLMIYYELQQQLYVAHSYFQNSISVFGQLEVNALKIKVPKLVAQGVQSRLIDKLLSDNIGSYHVGFIITEADEANRNHFSYIEPTSEVRRQYSARSLLAFPNDRLGRDVWRQAGLKILFFENASHNSFLYNNEKRPVTLVSGLDRDNQNFIDLLQQDAEKITIEEGFRPVFFSQTLPVLALQAPLNNSLAVARLADFFTTILPLYRSHIDYHNVGGMTSVPQIIDGRVRGQRILPLVTNSFAQDYAHNSLQNFLLASQNTLNHSAVMYGSLQGEALNQSLLEMMKATERRVLEFALGCYIFKDLAGAQSKCNSQSAPREPEIYTLENGWSAVELAQFRMAISDFVETLYGHTSDNQYSFAISPATWQAVAHIRGTVFDQVVSNKRYDMAKRLYSASVLWTQMGEAIKVIEDVIALNSHAGPNNQVPVPPVTSQGFRIIPESPVPGYVFLAVDRNSPLNRVPYAPSRIPMVSALGLDSPRLQEFAESFVVPDQTYNTAPWMGEILKNVAKKSSITRSPRERLELQAELQGLVVRFESLGSTLQNIAGGGVLDQVQRANARRTVVNDVWDRALSFMRPVTQYFNVSNRLGNLSGNGSSGNQDIVFDDMPMLIVPRTAAIESLNSIYQNLSHEQRFRWLSFSEQLNEISRSLGGNSVSSAHSEELAFISALRQLIAFGDRYESGALSAVARRIFERTIQGDVAQVLTFYRDVANFSSYLTRYHDLVNALFKEPSERDATLAQVLRQNPKAMKDYLLFSIVDLQQRFPILARRLKLPRAVQDTVGYEGRSNQENVGVPFYIIVARMGQAAANLHFTSAIDAAIERVRHLQGPYTADTLSQPVVSGNIDSILQAAIPLDQRSHTNGVAQWWDRFWEGATPPQTFDTPAEWWRDVVPLKVRDVLGATLDTQSRPDVRAGAVLTSALLGPYFRAMVDKGVRATRSLVDPTQTVWQALADSESSAMKLIFMEAGGMARGIEQIRTRELFWDQWKQQIVRWSSQFNADIFHVYFANMYLNVIPASLPVMHYVMLGAAMSDSALNWILRAQYLENYKTLSNFSPFLIPDDSVTVAQTMYVQQVHALRDRLPNDIIWFGSSFIFSIQRNFGNALNRAGEAISNTTAAVRNAVANRVNAIRAARAESAGTHITDTNGEMVEVPSLGDYQRLEVEPGSPSVTAQRGYRNRMRAREAETGSRYNQNDPEVVAAERALARIERFNEAVSNRLPGAGGQTHGSAGESEILTNLRRSCWILGVKAGASLSSIMEAAARLSALIPEQAANIRSLLNNVRAYFDNAGSRVVPLSADFSEPRFAQALEALGVSETASLRTIRARHRAALQANPHSSEVLNAHLDAAIEYATYRQAFMRLGIRPGMNFREAFGAYLRAKAAPRSADSPSLRTLDTAWELARAFFLPEAGAVIEARVPINASAYDATTANAFSALGAVAGETPAALEARYNEMPANQRAALEDQWNIAKAYFESQQAFMRQAVVFVPVTVPEWVQPATQTAPAAPPQAVVMPPVAGPGAAVTSSMSAPAGAPNDDRARFRLPSTTTDGRGTRVRIVP